MANLFEKLQIDVSGKTKHDDKACKKIKKFIIPKKDKETGNLISLAKDSNEYQRNYLPLLKQSFYDLPHRNFFEFKDVQLCNNQHLLNEYLERKKELKQMGRNERELQDGYGFILVNEKLEVKNITCNGINTNPLIQTALGDPNMGVCLQKYVDVLSPEPLIVNKLYFIIICKYIKGKVKTVAENRTSKNFIDPTPNCDIHLSKNFLPPGASLADAFYSSQMYIYEYGEEGAVKRPRQILPTALVEFVCKASLSTKKISIPKPLVFATTKQSELVWKGDLKDKSSVISEVGLYSDVFFTKPTKLGCAIKAKYKMKMSMVRNRYLGNLTRLSKKRQCPTLDHYLLYFELRCLPSDKSKYKVFKEYIKYLSSNEMVGIACCEDDVQLLLIPPCNLAYRLGLFNDEATIQNPTVLHCLFVSKIDVSTKYDNLKKKLFPHSQSFDRFDGGFRAENPLSSRLKPHVVQSCFQYQHNGSCGAVHAQNTSNMNLNSMHSRSNFQCLSSCKSELPKQNLSQEYQDLVDKIIKEFTNLADFSKYLSHGCCESLLHSIRTGNCDLILQAIKSSVELFIDTDLLFKKILESVCYYYKSTHDLKNFFLIVSKYCNSTNTLFPSESCSSVSKGLINDPRLKKHILNEASNNSSPNSSNHISDGYNAQLSIDSNNLNISQVTNVMINANIVSLIKNVLKTVSSSNQTSEASQEVASVENSSESCVVQTFDYGHKTCQSVKSFKALKENQETHDFKPNQSKHFEIVKDSRKSNEFLDSDKSQYHPKSYSEASQEVASVENSSESRVVQTFDYGHKTCQSVKSFKALKENQETNDFKPNQSKHFEIVKESRKSNEFLDSDKSQYHAKSYSEASQEVASVENSSESHVLQSFDYGHKTCQPVKSFKILKENQETNDFKPNQSKHFEIVKDSRKSDEFLDFEKSQCHTKSYSYLDQLSILGNGPNQYNSSKNLYEDDFTNCSFINDRVSTRQENAGLEKDSSCSLNVDHNTTTDSLNSISSPLFLNTANEDDEDYNWSMDMIVKYPKRKYEENYIAAKSAYKLIRLDQKHKIKSKKHKKKPLRTDKPIHIPLHSNSTMVSDPRLKNSFKAPCDNDDVVTSSTHILPSSKKDFIKKVDILEEDQFQSVCTNNIVSSTNDSCRDLAESNKSSTDSVEYFSLFYSNEDESQKLVEYFENILNKRCFDLDVPNKHSEFNEKVTIYIHKKNTEEIESLQNLFLIKNLRNSEFFIFNSIGDIKNSDTIMQRCFPSGSVILIDTSYFFDITKDELSMLLEKMVACKTGTNRCYLLIHSSILIKLSSKKTSGSESILHLLISFSDQGLWQVMSSHSCDASDDLRIQLKCAVGMQRKYLTSHRHTVVLSGLIDEKEIKDFRSNGIDVVNIHQLLERV